MWWHDIQAPPALIALVISGIDFSSSSSILRPVEDCRLERFGTHHGTVDLGLRQPLEVIDDVLIGDLESLDGREVAFLDDRAQGFGRSDGRGAAKGQIACFRDLVLLRIIRVPLDPEGETQRVAAGD
ncbi:MAG: hypothetical protein P8127_03290 [Acidobacteriota bacterium]